MTVVTPSTVSKNFKFNLVLEDALGDTTTTVGFKSVLDQAVLATLNFTNEESLEVALTEHYQFQEMKLDLSSNFGADVTYTVQQIQIL